MFKKTALAAGIGLALSATAQADYRVELSPTLTGGDTSSIGVDATLYLKSVDTSKGPLAEAAFQDRASYVSANYTDGEVDSDGALDDLEFEDYGAAGRFIFGDGGWILDAGYTRSETDSPIADLIGPDSFELDTFSVGAGKYLTDNTTLVVSYLNSEADDAGSDVDSYQADLQHLFLWGDDMGLKVQGTYGITEVEDEDDIDVYTLGATFYPCKNLGIGGSFSRFDNYGVEVDAYNASIEYFLTESFAVGAAYDSTDWEEGDLEPEIYSFTAKVRF